MITINVDYIQWKNEVDTKELKHLQYLSGSNYLLIAIDGPVMFKHTLDPDDNLDYETNYLPKANQKVGNNYSVEPFANKILVDGKKLFRRKHGLSQVIAANSQSEIVFTVPYNRAKINEVEIINANALDMVDLLVRSPLDANTAAAYGMPANYLLNQFGFNVMLSSGIYSDSSNYDADVYAGFQIVIVYKNQTSTDRNIGINLTYHEVV